VFDTVRSRYQSASDLVPRGRWWDYREEKKIDRKLDTTIETRTFFLNHELARLWIRNERNLTVEASLPKIAFGNNLQLLGDPYRALVRLDEFIRENVEGMRDIVPDFSYARVDYCHNFDVGRENIPHYIRAFSRNNLFRKKTLHNDEETISWRSRGRMVRVYNKEKEMIASKSLDTELAKGILRVEVEIRRYSQVLNNFLKGRGKPLLLLRDVLDPDVAYEMLKRHVERLRLDIPIAPKRRAFERLIHQFEAPRAMQLYGFYEALNSYGIAWVKEMLSPSTYYYFRKRLMDAGLWLACPEAEYLPPLILPKKKELLNMLQD